MTSLKRFSHLRSSRLELSLFVLLAAIIATIASGAYATAPAFAGEPAFLADTVAQPKHLPPGGEGTLVVQVTNTGNVTATGETTPIVVQDILPAGLEAVSITGGECELSTLRCEFAGALPAFESVLIEITVKVSATAPEVLTNEVLVDGGGAIDATSREAVVVSPSVAGDGIEKAQLVTTNENGSLDTLAGSHPYQLTTTISTDTSNTKDLRFELPAGLVGNTNVVAQCTTPEFGAILKEGLDLCPADTAIGVAAAYIGGSAHPITVPLFNLVPSRGEPARFGFEVQHIPVVLDTSVRTGRDYGVVVSVSNIPQLEGFNEAQVSFWGVPAAPSHNLQRGWNCLYLDLNQGTKPCEEPESPPQVPFLTLPTSCGGPAIMRSQVFGDSWAEPGIFNEHAEYTPEAGLQGCNRLRFEPSISVAPDGQEASTPTGLAVDVHEPQEGALNPTGFAASAVKSISVTLPSGVQIDPSGGNGLQACSDAQIGYTGLAELDPSGEPGVKTAQFTPYLPGSAAAKEAVAAGGAPESEETLKPGVNFCPDASKIATVKVKTPLLPNALEGEVYLAAPQNFSVLSGAPQENPFGSLIAMYLVAEDPVSGVLVKLAGVATPNPVTGQITATFESPQVPFEDAEVHFFGSDRAPLSTPASCGSYTTTTSLTPWSGTGAVSPSSFFEITSGPESPCADPRPFAPGFVAGSTNLQAGAFTSFTMTLTRPDADQTLSRVELRMPPGLLGSLAKVPLCPEPQASKGECGEASLIGSTVVSAGLGGDPYTVTGGKVYITTGYGGAPYGLTIVNPAQAGPFVLEEGRPVIVRAAVFVDPQTAALRIVSDSLPTILDGIPLQIQHVNVTIERAGGFTFNPTNCGAVSIGATLSSSEGATATASTPFQVTNCANLKLEPKVEALVNGDVTKANGTSFTVKISKPAGLGEQANLQKFKVELPKQLPSRLTTLQKACTKAQFLANPADCPAASVVGHMRALTPVLPVPVEGPLYFVSNGGESFPNLVAVLQGYGVTIDLTGTTFISKAGITSSTFGTIPDVPFSFAEVNLHNGPYSALTGLGDICAQSLAMPTEMIGQNGAKLNPDTKISVTGCSNSISVLSHSLKGRNLTVSVAVPAQGKVKLGGKGLSTASKTAAGRETVTLKLHATKRGKFATSVKVTFTPSKGKKQSKSLKVKFKKR